MDHAICIGIDKYLNLNETVYAENDASEFAKVLTDIFDVNNLILLLGSQATYKSIELTIKRTVKKIDADDRFFFFFAGHGANFNGQPHLSCFDSDTHDIVNSWHSLSRIIKDINSSGCNKSLYFIDACESTIKLGSRKQIRSQFTAKELEDYFKSVTYTSVFSSCSHKGIADVNEDEKHGIWSSFLLKALNGKGPEAINESNCITNTSLQRYLSIKVKEYCKMTPECTEIQEAFSWGKQEGEFIIIQFPEKRVILYDKIPPKPLQRVRFVVKTTRNVKSLSGFSKAKGHFIPKFYNGTAFKFVNNIAENEIKEHLDEVSVNLRKLFGLKLKDYQLDIQDGSGTFTCPYLKYSYSVALKRNDTSEVIFTGELIPLDINRLIEESKDFDSCFPAWFDYLMYYLPNEIDIKHFVNQLEDMDEEKLNGYSFKYNNECTKVVMKHSTFDREIVFKKDYIKILFKASEPIPKMLDGLKEIANQLLLVNPKMKLLS